MLFSDRMTTVLCQKTYLSITKWQKAYKAILLATEETTKKEATDLAAHGYSSLRMLNGVPTIKVTRSGQ